MELHRLSDGRLLGYQCFGDPHGIPLLYCHGWPSSRLEAGLIERLPVRLIAVDRPGYGASTACSGRTLLDWPADVESLLDALGVARLGIAGVSGGGPYALACACALPRRITAVGLICPVPPRGGARPGNSPLNLLYRVGRSKLLGTIVVGAARWLLLHRLPVPRVLGGAGLPRSDQEVLTARVVERLLAAFREGLRDGIAGALSDARIYAAPWGFSLNDIDVPVRIWHGELDSIVPRRALASWSSAAGARIEWMPGEGHYSVPLRHHPAVISWLSACA